MATYDASSPRPMPALRRNVLSNYAGQAWMALMGVVFVPLYIRALGMESFALVGLMLSIQALSMLLDLGMGGVLNRELARRSHDPNLKLTMGDLVRTFEYLVWPIALLVALAIWLASGYLANHWLHPEHLTREETKRAIAVMGLAIALQWPSSFYANGLSGLEQQLRLNWINAGFATLRSAGVLGVIYWISPTISAFMWWYALVAVGQSTVSAIMLWRLLPFGNFRESRFHFLEIQSAGRFAGGLLSIMALSVMLMQLDRIVLSAMRPLTELGYFSLAMSVTAGMGRMIQPMFNAVYPRYSKLVAQGKDAALTHLYHLSNQCLCAMVAAMAAVLITYAKDVMYLWTGDLSLAMETAPALSILAAGTALNGLMNLPYALQLANGWTQLTVGANLVALLLGLPFCVWAVHHYGIAGAAGLWLLTNLGFVCITIPLMHRRLMQKEMGKWYLQDVLPPFATATAMGLLCHWLAPSLPRSAYGLMQLATISAATLLAALIASTELRSMALERLATRPR